MTSSEWIVGCSDISMCKSFPSISEMASSSTWITGGRFWVPGSDVEAPGDLQSLQEPSSLETSHPRTSLLINSPLPEGCHWKLPSPGSRLWFSDQQLSSHLAQAPILQYFIITISLPLSLPPLNCNLLEEEDVSLGILSFLGPSIVSSEWDRHWKKNQKINIILYGKYLPHSYSLPPSSLLSVAHKGAAIVWTWNVSKSWIYSLWSHGVRLWNLWSIRPHWQ